MLDVSADAVLSFHCGELYKLQDQKMWTVYTPTAVIKEYNLLLLFIET